MCQTEEGDPQKWKTLLPSRKIGISPIKRCQKGSQSPKVEYVWVFICPDGSTLQHPKEPRPIRRRKWLKIAKGVLAFAIKVMI